MITSVFPPRSDGRYEALQALKTERLARVRKAIGAKRFDAELSAYYARLDADRGIAPEQ